MVARVAPMPGKALPVPAQAVPPATPSAPAAPAAPLPAKPAAPRAAAEITVGTAPAGLDAKRWQALRRGRMKPERTLDLHGRRAQDAHGAVRQFLFAAVAEGLRCVAIVTGKGSSLEGGVLRRELPHWLNGPELRPLLLGAAHPHATNPGAVHLMLRRPRARP